MNPEGRVKYWSEQLVPDFDVFDEWSALQAEMRAQEDDPEHVRAMSNTDFAKLMRKKRKKQ